MLKSIACLFVSSALIVAAAEEPAWEEIAAKAVREAAEKAAREKAATEAAAKATAEAAAKAAAEATVKTAVEKAATEAAAAAAKAAAAEAAKVLTDEKAAKEEAKENLRQIDTRIFRLVHASAVEVADKLNEMWNGEFGQVWKVTKMAVPFEESNTIIVTAPRSILNACEKIVGGLDVEAQQVYIEARFVELGNTASHKLGIDWSMLGGMKGATTVGGGIQSTTVGNGVQEYTRTLTGKDGSTTYKVSGGNDADGSVTYFNGTLNFSEMYLVLQALDATEDTKTFSNPKIIVSSGKKAKVDMTQKYPNVTISAKRTSSGGNSDSLDLSMNMEAIPGEDKFMFAKEAFFSWGIELEVTPRVGTNGLINVQIVPTISSQTDWVTSGAGDTKSEGSNVGTYSSKYPVISVKRLITEFNMKSGSTAVIGGLSKTEEIQVDNGIPLLRDIPWIGPRLFGSMTREKVQREIIVFVTVGLVNPREMSENAGLPKNAVLGRQYTEGQKLEPGDRPQKNMEGIDSLDTRLLEEQAKDPLRHQKSAGFDFKNYIPFRKESDGNLSADSDTGSMSVQQEN